MIGEVCRNKLYDNESTRRKSRYGDKHLECSYAIFEVNVDSKDVYGKL